MATLTRHDEHRIAFETTGDERALGLLLALHGAAFAGAPLYALPAAILRRRCFSACSAPWW
jgi:hypothetical protein